ncbi:hypothetical protein LUX09_34150 [Streptomyces albogriseolus]|nr:hypothetical protein [Streptomyces albogriseolus]
MTSDAVTVVVRNRETVCAARLRYSWEVATTSKRKATTMKVRPVRPAALPPTVAANVVHMAVAPVRSVLGWKVSVR